MSAVGQYLPNLEFLDNQPQTAGRNLRMAASDSSVVGYSNSSKSR